MKYEFNLAGIKFATKYHEVKLLAMWSAINLTLVYTAIK
jgi:hypothetical protein